jgi:type IV pilus assembly protein PilQ
MGLRAADAPAAPGNPVRLLAVAPAEQPAGTSLEVRASGPFTFTSYQPHERHLIVDLAGVTSDATAHQQAGSLPWLSGYRLLPFRNAAGRQVLRMDVSLSRACVVELAQLTPSVLTLSCPGSASLRAEAPAAVPSEPSGAAPAAESAPPVSDHPSWVRRVIVHQKAGAVIVDVVASAALGYEVLKLENPPRLVLDLPQSILVARRRKISVDESPVVGIRVAQFKADPPITRLVVDLTRMISYQVNTTPQGLRLVLSEALAAESMPARELQPVAPVVAAPPAPEPEAAPATPQSSPAAVEPVPAVAATADEASPNEVEAEPQPVLLASLAPTVVSLPPAAVAESVAPAPAVTRPEPVAAAPAMASLATRALQQAPSGAGAEPATAYTGEPISVNLKDVDLKDFFRLIHEISGLNIVLDPKVGGTVTLALLDVPWDQVLDLVLKNNGLGSTLEGNVLRIATLETLRKEQQELASLAKAREEVVEPVTVTRQLSYAKAADLEPTLKQFLSDRGELIRDDRTNTLIIRDIPEIIPQLDSLIQQLDRKSLQVEIEARVVSASRAFTREIGSQFAFSASRFRSDGSFQRVFGGDLGPSSLDTSGVNMLPPLIAAGTDGQQPLNTSLRAVETTSTLLFGHRSPAFALDIILSAAENRQIAKILSRPRVITQNNVAALVLQGTRIPVQTVVNNTITTQFIDVALKLEVTPQITAEGTVFLDINIENTAIDTGIARINGIPALRTQQETTQVLVSDGGTVVIGGVMITESSTSIDQVPILGSIPVIGYLFKRSRVTTGTQELLFFITPRILPS